jgi:uncharacterized protein YeaO (DUF488 family)
VKDRIRTGRIYDAPGRRDGARVLIMRLWPRGVRKARVDRWLKELGPSLPLLRAFRRGALTWTQYRRRYLAGLASPPAQAAVSEVRALAKRRPVTLLCGCADEARCHRSLLRVYLARRVV